MATTKYDPMRLFQRPKSFGVYRYLLLLLPFFPLGCGAGSAELSGKVSFNGRHLASGSVVIVGHDGLPRYGNIEPDGSYKVEHLSSGMIRIGVSSPNPNADLPRDLRQSKLGGSTDASADIPEGWFEIPAKYFDPESSGLTLELKRGQNTHDIQLE
jgi:hypothetical protein